MLEDLERLQDFCLPETDLDNPREEPKLSEDSGLEESKSEKGTKVLRSPLDTSTFTSAVENPLFSNAMIVSEPICSL